MSQERGSCNSGSGAMALPPWHVSLKKSHLDGKGQRQYKMKRGLWTPQNSISEKQAKKTMQLQTQVAFHGEGRKMGRVAPTAMRITPEQEQDWVLINKLPTFAQLNFRTATYQWLRHASCFSPFWTEALIEIIVCLFRPSYVGHVCLQVVQITCIFSSDREDLYSRSYP